MLFFKRYMCTVTLCLMFLMCVLGGSEGRTMNALGMDELLPMGGAKAKRRLFDPSCKGIYDREIFNQLEQVCNDCYNLYRKPFVAAECRRDCYNSEVFDGCLRDLMFHDDFIDNYKGMAQMVSGKK